MPRFPPKRESYDCVIPLAGQFEYINAPDAFLEGIYPSIGLAYATDFELEADVYAVELDVLPVLDLPGQGVKRPLFSGSPIAFRWRVAGHAEGGYTADAGDDAALEEDKGFVRFGPKATLELLPELDYLERLRARFDYQFLKGFWGSPDSSHLLESSLSVRLDERGFASIDLNYRDGDIPLLATSTQLLTLGLGLRF
jgi:hypothetical protein